MEGKENQSVVEHVSKELLDEIFASTGNTLVDKKEENIENTTKKEATEIVAEQIEKTTEETKPTEVVKTVTDYSKKIRNLIADGIIDNFSITIDNNGETQEVFIEDLENLEEEGYKQIIEGWKKAKDEEVKNNYIPKEGIDSVTEKLIEIRKTGGDITELIRDNVTAIDQITTLKNNIDNEAVQVDIVRHSLKQQGLRPQVIEAQIKALIDEGSLETEATTIIDSHLKLHNDAIELKKQEAIERVEKEKEDMKNLKKSLSSTYKELGIPDTLQKVLISNATQLDQDKISNTDKLYFEAIKDPVKFAKLNLFLNNEEEFNKYLTSSVVTKTKIETIKPLFTVNIGNTNKPRVSKDSLDDLVDDIIKTNN